VRECLGGLHPFGAGGAYVDVMMHKSHDPVRVQLRAVDFSPTQIRSGRIFRVDKNFARERRGRVIVRIGVLCLLRRSIQAQNPRMVRTPIGLGQ